MPTALAKDHAKRWGLGDVFGGLIAAQVLALISFQLVYSIAGWDQDFKPTLVVFALFQIPLWSGYVGATLLAGRKGGGLSDFGWAAKRTDALWGIPLGILCQLVLLPVIYWPLLKLFNISKDKLSEPAQELADRAGGLGGWVVLFVMVAICAPIVEELFYRGLVLQSLIKAGLPGWVGALVSVALFAVVHFRLLQLLGLFAFGLVLAGLALRTSRLGPSIWAHGGFNATTVVYLYLSS